MAILPTSQNPTHSYVQLQVFIPFHTELFTTTIDGCSDSLTKNNFIHINGPIAKFSASPLAGCKPLNVTFSDSSATDGINAIKNWQWDFGDGITQNFSAPPFNHSYDSSGSFFAQLKITDAFGCSDSFNLSTPILVTAPKAVFNSVDTLACVGSNVSFNNTSSGIDLMYAWTLGNGLTSTQLNPLTTYPADGNYTIKISSDWTVSAAWTLCSLLIILM